MKTYDIVTIPPQPERIELRVVAVNCDLCNERIKHFREDGAAILNPLFRQRYGNAVEVQIQLRAGEHNLDGGVGETTSFDICPECFQHHLQPWLEAQGAEPRVESWNS